MSKEKAVTTTGEGLQSVGDAFDPVALAKLIETSINSPLDDEPEKVEIPEEVVAEDSVEEVAEEVAETPEEAEEDSDEPEEGVSDRVQKLIDKRIGKEVAKRKVLEAELAEARKTQESRSSEPEAVEQPARFQKTETTELNAIQAKLKELTSLKDWCGTNEDGCEVADNKGETKYYEAKEIRRIKDKVSDEINDLKSDEKVILREQKYEFSRQESEYNSQADATFPWLKDKTSEESVLFAQVLNLLPEMKRLPQWKLAAAVHVLGLKQLRAMTEKKPVAKKPQIPTAQPSRPATTGTSERLTKDEAAKRSLRNRAAAAPSDRDAMIELLTAQRSWQ